MAGWLNIANGLKNVPKDNFGTAKRIWHISNENQKIYDLTHKYKQNDHMSDICEDCRECNCFGDGNAIEIYDVTMKDDIFSLFICDECINILPESYVVGNNKILIRVQNDSILNCDNCKKQIDKKYWEKNVSGKNDILSCKKLDKKQFKFDFMDYA